MIAAGAGSWFREYEVLDTRIVHPRRGITLASYQDMYDIRPHAHVEIHSRNRQDIPGLEPERHSYTPAS